MSDKIVSIKRHTEVYYAVAYFIIFHLVKIN